MTDKIVVWIDDEPNLISGEIFDLENKGFEVIPLHDPGKALDWIHNNEERVCKSAAIIVDVLMPSRGDERFSSSIGEPVGLLLCKNLLLTFPRWNDIKLHLTLYTRSPNSNKLTLVRKFADENQLNFIRKSASSRIALELFDTNMISR